MGCTLLRPTGSPNGSGGVSFFNGPPNGSGGVSFFNGLPNGSGGVSDFFFQWSAQRARGDSFLSTGSPNGSGRVSDFIFNGLPNGPGGDSFLSTGSPNGSGRVSDFTPSLPLSFSLFRVPSFFEWKDWTAEKGKAEAHSPVWSPFWGPIPFWHETSRLAASQSGLLRVPSFFGLRFFSFKGRLVFFGGVFFSRYLFWGCFSR